MASKVKNLLSKIPNPRRTKSRDMDAEEKEDKEEEIKRKEELKRINSLLKKKGGDANTTARKVEKESLAILEDALGESSASESDEEDGERESTRADGERRIFFVWKKGPLTLQGAVDVATDGDKVVLSAGTYDGVSVVVNKSIDICVSKRRCVLSNSKEPIFTFTSGHSTLTQITLNYTGQDHGAIRITGGTTTVRSCHITSTGEYGISLAGPDANPTFSRNIISKCKGRGLVALACKGTFDSNEVASDAAGVFLGEGACSEVTRNKIKDCKSEGAITVTGGSTGTVEGNEIMGSTIGIFITEQGNPICTSNKVSRCSTGILISDDGLGTIKTNEVSNNTGTGIELIGNADPQLIRNIIKENKREGILVTGAKGTIDSNEIIGSALDGVSIKGESHVTFTNNQVLDCKGVGFLMQENATGVYTGNTIANNSKGDIQVPEGCAFDFNNNSYGGVA